MRPGLSAILRGAALSLVGCGALHASEPRPTPTLNFYGVPGALDMPSGESMADGEVAVAVSSFGGMTRGTLSFQFLPRISGSFRYSGLQDWNFDGFSTYYDRSFDLRFQVLKESQYIPAVTVGLQDFVGTGIYSAEYIAATKNFQRGIRVTAGLGWGRLGSYGSIGAPFGEDRPSFTPGDTGGEFNANQWFRGPMAPFAAVEWQATPQLGVKVEYSSDAYEIEDGERGLFERKSPWNFGVDYQFNRHLSGTLSYMYGSQLGLNLVLSMDPKTQVTPFNPTPAPPVVPRPPVAGNADAWQTEWAALPEAQPIIAEALGPMLAREGLALESLHVTATTAELRFRNDRFGIISNAVGRVARIMSGVLPASVETFRIVPVQGGVPMSAVIINRSDLERLEFAFDGDEQMLSRAVFEDAGRAPDGSLVNPDIYPKFFWTATPYLLPSYFDPNRPFRFDVGVRGTARYEVTRGFTLAGSVRARVYGNIADSEQVSDSALPPVRTDAVLYAQEGNPAIENLFGNYAFRPTRDVYARVIGGYFEDMFGGVGGEVLWKPADSRIAVGAELVYAVQRDYDILFGFQDYSIVTGHASVYYDMPNGLQWQVDAGRYLAGDWGGTLTLSREFGNGWRVGAFATLTDVSAEDFGEGSFDKGIILTVPISWLSGEPSKSKFTTTIRPVQRDGGARVILPGRLYETVREHHEPRMAASWGRFWK